MSEREEENFTMFRINSWMIEIRASLSWEVNGGTFKKVRHRLRSIDAHLIIRQNKRILFPSALFLSIFISALSLSLFVTVNSYSWSIGRSFFIYACIHCVSMGAMGEWIHSSDDMGDSYQSRPLIFFLLPLLSH